MPSKRRTNTPYRRHYKQLVLDHTGDIPSATLAHNRDLDAADSLLMLHGGNLANKISDVADTVGTAAGLAGLRQVLCSQHPRGKTRAKATETKKKPECGGGSDRLWPSSMYRTKTTLLVDMPPTLLRPCLHITSA
eukprot:COSAG01_NODE_225_length_21277_cov_71.340023_25_plen_135_part_00